MIRTAILSPVVLLACVTSSASAQNRGFVGVGVGVGAGYPGWGYYGLPYGPYAYGYPGAIGGSWTNGHTLYGPPVPTYGPTPGAFGGGDAHRGHSTYGWLGSYNPSPRPSNLTVNGYPAGGRAVLTGASVDAIAPREVPRPDPTPSSKARGGLLGFGLFKR